MLLEQLELRGGLGWLSTPDDEGHTKKWQSLSSPRPIAVLAAPPVNGGISQGEDASGTAFGKEALRGSASTDELGASYGATMSFDSSVLIAEVRASGERVSVVAIPALLLHRPTHRTQLRALTRHER